MNHMFILNVDPRCRITPEYFFARAATLTTLWILIFGSVPCKFSLGEHLRSFLIAFLLEKR